ncbi:MAG: hypothetical protein JXA90_08990, partial [Planctomycetes bacterium]|nr:hypothetical protein [Planctomycetota bacterium]
MPYLAPRRNPLLSDVSSVGPSSSATSSATPAATAAPESPAYQDLRAYLGANAPQAKEIAGRILSPIAETAEGAATELGTNMTEEQRTAKNAAREDAAAKLAGTGNAGFWGEKLEGIGGGTYSPGQRNMDEYLLTAAGADASARALRDQYAHRLGTYSAPRPIS